MYIRLQARGVRLARFWSAGRIPEGEQISVAHGKFARLGRLVRMELVWEGGPSFQVANDHDGSGATSPAGDLTVTSYPIDVCTDGRVDITHQLKAQGKLDEYVVVGKSDERETNWAVFTGLCRGIRTPFAPTGDPIERILTLRPSATGAESHAVSEEVVSIDATHVALRLSRPNVDGEVGRTIKFWTEPSPPVIQEIVFWSKSPTHSQDSESVIALSEYVTCGDIMVGSCVRCVIKASGGKFLLWEWRSDDLGKSRPQGTDFVVISDVDAPVYGINQGTIVNGRRRLIDPSDIKLEQLGPELKIIAKPKTDGTDGASVPNRFVLWITAGLAAALVVIIVVRRIASDRMRGAGL